ncbi:unnamed protein product [Phytomonas sp. Hart1]|nr:unnamed protein product [Phytomonas sp. Hart1]|eukprot:CCW69096.1 unnamed protein product [Phytomonas sp. isolate Hart1]
MTCSIKRLSKEYHFLQNPVNRVCEVYAAPLQDNIFVWHFTIKGPDNDELGYSEGLYHGALLFPRTYPFAPPDIQFFTPSGRFETHTKICSTISSYHPERWQPTIDVSTILIALRMFMEQEGDIGSGGINSSNYSRHDKQKMAKKSRDYICSECGCSSQEIWEKEMSLYPRIAVEKKTSVEGISSQSPSGVAVASNTKEESEVVNAISPTQGLEDSEKDPPPGNDNFIRSRDGSRETSVDADKTVEKDEKEVENLVDCSPDTLIHSVEVVTDAEATPHLTEPAKMEETLGCSDDNEKVNLPVANVTENSNTEGRRSEMQESAPSFPSDVEAEENLPTMPESVDADSSIQLVMKQGPVVEDAGVDCLVKDEHSKKAMPTSEGTEGGANCMNYGTNHNNRAAMRGVDNDMSADKFDLECEERPALGAACCAAGTTTSNVESDESKNTSGENGQKNNQQEGETTKKEELPKPQPSLEVEIASLSIRISIRSLDWLINICAIIVGLFWLHRLSVILFRYYFSGINVRSA